MKFAIKFAIKFLTIIEYSIVKSLMERIKIILVNLV